MNAPLAGTFFFLLCSASIEVGLVKGLETSRICEEDRRDKEDRNQIDSRAD